MHSGVFLAGNACMQQMRSRVIFAGWRFQAPEIAILNAQWRWLYKSNCQSKVYLHLTSLFVHVGLHWVCGISWGHTDTRSAARTN